MGKRKGASGVAPGVAAFLSILALITLWVTGWFSRLPRDLGLSSGNELLGWLLAASVSSVVEITVSPTVTLHVGVLWLFFAFLRLMREVPSSSRLSVGTALLFFGFAFFIAGELSEFDPAWVLFPLQRFCLAFLIGLTLLVAPRLDLRLSILTGGMLTGIILSSLSPLSSTGGIRIGSAVHWDMLWISMIALTALHHVLSWAERKLFRFRAKL